MFSRRFSSYRIIYRDANLLAVNKPADSPVHFGPGIRADQCLLSQINKELGFGAHLINRLDSDASGIVLFALNSAAAAAVNSLFANYSQSHSNSKAKSHSQSHSDSDSSTDSTSAGFLRKHYEAILIPNRHGNSANTRPPPRFPEFRLLDSPLAKLTNSRGQSRMSLAGGGVEKQFAQAAATKFSLLKAGKIKFSVNSPARVCWQIRCEPITGRQHQIRVHAAQALGAPIFGDRKYGPANSNAAATQFLHLHAESLELFHPSLADRPIMIVAEKPDFFKETIKNIQLD